MAPDDPDCYPGTYVLRHKPGIRNRKHSDARRTIGPRHGTQLFSRTYQARPCVGATFQNGLALTCRRPRIADVTPSAGPRRSEEHTSELQSRENLVCRLL